MAKFLIDVNLPYHVSLWKGDEYVHQKDIDDEWTDTQIWNYARSNDLTIALKTAISPAASSFTNLHQDAANRFETGHHPQYNPRHADEPNVQDRPDGQRLSRRESAEVI